MAKEQIISDAVTTILVDIAHDVNESICKEIEKDIGEMFSKEERVKLDQSGSKFILQNIDFIQKVIEQCALDCYTLTFDNKQNQEHSLAYHRFLSLASQASYLSVYYMFGERVRLAMVTENPDFFIVAAR